MLGCTKNRKFICSLSGFCSSGIPTREHCFIAKQNWYEIYLVFKRQDVLASSPGRGVWRKLYSLKLIFNCHMTTLSLIICFKSFLFRFVQFQCLSPTHGRSFRNVNRRSDVVVLTSDPSYKIQRMYPKARLKRFRQNILKRLKKPLIIIWSQDLNSNDHSTEMYEDDYRVTFLWNANSRSQVRKGDKATI